MYKLNNSSKSGVDFVVRESQLKYFHILVAHRREVAPKAVRRKNFNLKSNVYGIIFFS